MDADFKKNLRAELDFKALTTKELSAQTGIPCGTLNCYLSARASLPPANIAVKIARALDVSVEYLVTGKDEKMAPSCDQIIRSITETALSLSGKDRVTLLGIAQLLKKQAENAGPAD